MGSQVVEKIEGVELKETEEKIWRDGKWVRIKEVDSECRPIVHVKKVIPTVSLTYILLCGHISCLSPCDASINLMNDIHRYLS